MNFKEFLKTKGIEGQQAQTIVDWVDEYQMILNEKSEDVFDKLRKKRQAETYSKFDNKDRNRYYGLRVGDIVNAESIIGTILYENCEVIAYGFMNNNKVMLRNMDGEEFEYIAEWCNIVKKVES